MTTSALPVNADAGDQPPTPASGTDRQWCPGRLDANAVTQPTNTLWLKAGQIYPFVNNVRVYHCPADSSTYVTTDQAMCAVNGPGDPRVRSISMNGFVNASPDDFFSGGFTVYRKTNALAHPGAAVLWLFLDENPYSINDAYFVNNPSNAGNPPTGSTWTDCPGGYHNGASGMGFCDGHAMMKPWHDATVLKWTDTTHEGMAANAPGANKNADLDWLLNQTTCHQ
jgi:prepilin-type processing-associated H-X9-DG protein